MVCPEYQVPLGAGRSCVELAAYVARVKRHYAMFREDVEQGNRPGPDGRSTKIGRNDPCPCGSGRKYKKCCAGNEREAGAEW